MLISLGWFIFFVIAKVLWEKTKLKELESSNPSTEICLASIFLLSITAKISLFLSFPTLIHYLSKSIIDHRGFLNLSASSVFYVFRSNLKIFVQWRFTYSKQLFASKHNTYLPFCYFILCILPNPHYFFFSCVIALYLTLEFLSSNHL